MLLRFSPKRLDYRFVPLLIFSLSAVPVDAADLLQIYREALANDSTYASARATRDAGLESLPQGLAQVLPTVSATGFVQNNNVDIKFREIAGVPAAPESQRQGPTSGFTVTLTQPLFNWQNFQVYKEAGFKAVQAEALFGQATQDLIVRVAQAYSTCCLPRQPRLHSRAEGQSPSNSRSKGFEVGTATITDTHEAQARFDLATSQEIAAQSDLEIKKRTLQQIVGKFPEQLTPLKANIELNPPKPNAMEDWASAASTQGYPVRAQEANVEVAVREIERVRAGHLPTLNLVGNAGVSNSGLSTTATVNTASDSTNLNIGLQLAVPLYAEQRQLLVRQAAPTARTNGPGEPRRTCLSARFLLCNQRNGAGEALEAALVSAAARSTRTSSDTRSACASASRP
jgi:outer membrane protein